MASISGESLIQVDEPDNHVNPSMLRSPIGTPTSRQTRFAIPDKRIEFVCESLGRCIGPDDDDVTIQYSLKFVWLTVEHALSEDPEVIERLANMDEFEANVKDEGVKRS
jgi:hypothetical protein